VLYIPKGNSKKKEFSDIKSMRSIQDTWTGLEDILSNEILEA
jgi:hypothetical protein